MAVRVVTFDFHNTLAVCDDWFELEVRSIVPRFLDWYEALSGQTIPPAARHDGAMLYRALREDIMLHGREHDALTCTLHVLGLLGIPVTVEVAERGVDDLMRSTLANCYPVEGAVEAVQQLRAAGIRLGVVSSAAHHSFLEWSLAKFGLLHEFEIIGSSATIGYYKSSGKIYERVLERMRVRAEEAIHIGDSHRFDVEPAGRIGMGTVWLDPATPGRIAHDADLRVTTLRGLAPLLLSGFIEDDR